MHIGLVIYGDLSVTSGGYLYDRMLVQCLERRGDEVEIISLPWRRYGNHLGDNLSSQLYRQLASSRFDIVLQDELNHPSLCFINLRLRRAVATPLISIVHHLRCDEAHPRPLPALYRFVERQYLRSVSGFVFNSQTTRHRVLAQIHREPDNIVAYPAADHLGPPSTDMVHGLIRSRIQNREPLQILFVGNVIPRKGLSMLISSLSRLPNHWWHLHVVGSLDVDHRYSSRVRRTVAKLGLDTSVNFYGAVSTSILRQLYSTCHLLAVPSFEGFGIIYLEAMSFGMPVIATTAGAAHEIVANGTNGYLVTPGDVSAIAERVSASGGKFEIGIVECSSV